MYDSFRNDRGETSWPLPRRVFQRIDALTYVDDEAHRGIPPRQITLELSEGFWQLAAWMEFRDRQRAHGIDRPPTDREFEALSPAERDAYAAQCIRNDVHDSLFREYITLHAGDNYLLFPNVFAAARSGPKT